VRPGNDEHVRHGVRLTARHPGADSQAPESTLPADTVDPGAAAFERQLAELSFGTFLAIELDVSPGVFTCTEPRSIGPDEIVTCFALVDDQRVVIARSRASDGTGRFMFDVLADYEIVGSSEAPPPGSEPLATDAPDDPSADSAPVTYSDAERNDANVAILVYGDELDQSASTEIGAIVEAANGSVLAVSTWRWDATTAAFTIDYTLNPDAGLSTDESAWLTASAMSAHWEVGQPFRNPAATIRPALSIAVGGVRFESSWDLMTQVADGAVADAEWLAAARQG
jgi:hypothetical protein